MTPNPKKILYPILAMALLLLAILLGYRFYSLKNAAPAASVPVSQGNFVLVGRVVAKDQGSLTLKLSFPMGNQREVVVRFTQETPVRAYILKSEEERLSALKHYQEQVKAAKPGESVAVPNPLIVATSTLGAFGVGSGIEVRVAGAQLRSSYDALLITLLDSLPDDPVTPFPTQP